MAKHKNNKLSQYTQQKIAENRQNQLWLLNATL